MWAAFSSGGDRDGAYLLDAAEGHKIDTQKITAADVDWFARGGEAADVGDQPQVCSGRGVGSAADKNSQISNGGKTVAELVSHGQGVLAKFPGVGSSPPQQLERQCSLISNRSSPGTSSCEVSFFIVSNG